MQTNSVTYTNKASNGSSCSSICWVGIPNSKTVIGASGKGTEKLEAGSFIFSHLPSIFERCGNDAAWETRIFSWSTTFCFVLEHVLRKNYIAYLDTTECPPSQFCTAKRSQRLQPKQIDSHLAGRKRSSCFISRGTLQLPLRALLRKGSPSSSKARNSASGVTDALEEGSPFSSAAAPSSAPSSSVQFPALPKIMDAEITGSFQAQKIGSRIYVVN